MHAPIERRPARITSRGLPPHKSEVITSAPGKHHLFPAEPHLYPDGIRLPKAPRLIQGRVHWENEGGGFYPKPESAPDPNIAIQRASRWHRDGWRAVCRALGIRDPEPDGRPVGIPGKYYGYSILDGEKDRARFRRPIFSELRGGPLGSCPPKVSGRFNLQVPSRRATRLTNYRWHWCGPRPTPDTCGPAIEIDIEPTTLELLPLRPALHYSLPPLGERRTRPDCPHSLAPPLPRLLAFHGGIWRVLAPKHVRRLEGWDKKEWVAWVHYDWRERDDLPTRTREHDFMAHWRIERQPDRWRSPWPMRDPSWSCPFPLRPPAYFTARARSEIGLKLERVGVCHCTWRDYSTSTYVPYRRPKPGVVGSFIEGAAEDEMTDDQYARLLLSDGEYREQLEEQREAERPEDEEKNRDAWGEYVELLHEVGGEPEEELPELTRDIHTRYAWQVPRDIPYSRTLDSDRRRAWTIWQPLLWTPGEPRPQALSLSRTEPWKAEGISRATWYRRRETTSS
jgi:hypothetical protein